MYTYIGKVHNLWNVHAVEAQELEGDGVLRHVRRYVLLHNVATLHDTIKPMLNQSQLTDRLPQKQHETTLAY